MSLAIVNVSEIDTLKKSDGKITEVNVRFTVESDDSNVNHFFPGLESVLVPIVEIPENILTALNMYVDIAMAKVPVPSKTLSGKKINASPDLRHISYMINRQETTNEVIWISGYYLWPGGQRENLQLRLTTEDFTKDQLRLFLQMKPWAREISENRFKAKIAEVIGGEPPTEIIIKKSEVLISYKRGEGDEFAEELFRRLGQSRLFIPRYDKYDVDAGPWMAQLERLLLSAAAMVPIITPGYEEGNISQLERDLAIIREREEEGFRIVTALFSAEPQGFLKTYQRVDFRNSTSAQFDANNQERFDQLIDLVGGVKRNPYG